MLRQGASGLLTVDPSDARGQEGDGGYLRFRVDDLQASPGDPPDVALDRTNVAILHQYLSRWLGAH